MSRVPAHLLRSAALVVSLGASCLAQAADFPVALPPEPPVPVAIGAAWYLRGDVGVGVASIKDIKTELKKGYLPDGYAVKDAGITDQFFAGAGVGVQVTPFLRGDITGEYRGGANIHAYDSFPVEFGDAAGRYNGHLSSILVLANGYFDLGTWYGLTPFVGAGIGGAFHQVHGFYETPLSPFRGFGKAPDRWSNSLAWALHAGVAYNITPNFLVEVGYRYTNMGKAKSGGVVCIEDPSCDQATYKLKEIHSHDVRIGLRYLLGGFAAVAPLPPVYEPGPVVSKY